MVFWQQMPAQATATTFLLPTALGCCFYLVGIRRGAPLRPSSMSRDLLGETQQAGQDVLLSCTHRGVFWGAGVTPRAPTRNRHRSLLSPSSGNIQPRPGTG